MELKGRKAKWVTKGNRENKGTRDSKDHRVHKVKLVSKALKVR